MLQVRHLYNSYSISQTGSVSFRRSRRGNEPTVLFSALLQGQPCGCSRHSFELVLTLHCQERFKLWLILTNLKTHLIFVCCGSGFELEPSWLPHACRGFVCAVHHALGRDQALPCAPTTKVTSSTGTYLIVLSLPRLHKRLVLRLLWCIHRHSLLFRRFLSAERVGRRSTGNGPIVQAIACNHSDVAVRLGSQKVFMVIVFYSIMFNLF